MSPDKIKSAPPGHCANSQHGTWVRRVLASAPIDPSIPLRTTNCLYDDCRCDRAEEEMRECECEGAKEGGLFPSECEHGQSCMGVVIVVVLGGPRLQAVVMFGTLYQVANNMGKKDEKFDLWQTYNHSFQVIISAL